MQKVGGQKYQGNTLVQERQNQGKLTMKAEAMTTNQKDLVTGMQSQLLETKPTKNTDGTQQTQSLLPVYSNDLAKRG